jgi:hypothetical protein
VGNLNVFCYNVGMKTSHSLCLAKIILKNFNSESNLENCFLIVKVNDNVMPANFLCKLIVIFC